MREPAADVALVALDIDGTLCDADGVVPDSVRRAVRRVLDAGRHVVLATGRSLHGTLPIARELGLQRGWLVCSNGTVTATYEGDDVEVVDVITFDAAPAVALLRRHLPDALFAVEELGVGYRVTGAFPDGELTGEILVVPPDDLVAAPVNRVIVRSPLRGPEDFLDVVPRLGLQEVAYAIGHTAWLDLAPDGVNKASALDVVRDRLGVDPGATVAVGDGRNDLEMLRWAACGVAMGQAPAEVQDAADLVTDTFDDDGLARALARLG